MYKSVWIYLIQVFFFNKNVKLKTEIIQVFKYIRPHGGLFEHLELNTNSVEWTYFKSYLGMLKFQF